MTRENGYSLFGLLVLLAALGAFLYWYWSPKLPLDTYWPSAAATEVDRHAAAPAATASLAQAAPTTAPATTTPPVLAAYCPPGQPARFVLGFERLKARLGDTMGEPLECEHVNPANGDALQQTTTGLAVYRTQTGDLEFTDGWRHWALRGEALVAWVGDAPSSAQANRGHP